MTDETPSNAELEAQVKELRQKLLIQTFAMTVLIDKLDQVLPQARLPEYFASRHAETIQHFFPNASEETTDEIEAHLRRFGIRGLFRPA